MTEVVARPNDDMDILKAKVRIATILGTIQATLTNFKYLRACWKHTTDEERLLGVSITGIYDCPFLNGTECSLEELGQRLCELKEYAIAVNKEYARRLGMSIFQ